MGRMTRRCFKPWDILRAQGFTLIELAIVLAILGLLLGGASMLLQPVLDNNKRTETRARLKSIEDALTIYAATNFDLPCPSNPALGPGAALNGVEANPVTVCNAGTNPMAAGGVPWQTLGLSEADVMDGWGRRISYALTGNLAAAAGAPPATAPLNCPANGFSLILRGKLENRGANNAAIGAAAPGAADAARAPMSWSAMAKTASGAICARGRKHPIAHPPARL